MALKSDANIKEKLTFGFKYDMRNLVNFHPTAHSKIWAEKIQRVIFYDTEQWYKIWVNPELVVSKMTWKIGWTFITALKNLKICIITVCIGVSQPKKNKHDPLFLSKSLL